MLKLQRCNSNTGANTISGGSRRQVRLQAQIQHGQVEKHVNHGSLRDEKSWMSQAIHQAKKSGIALAACLTLSCGLSSNLSSATAITQIRVPVSNEKDIAQVQEVMIEAWSVVDDVYYDTAALKRIDWQQTLSRSMVRASVSGTPDSAYSEISAMLNSLGDPYTRIISPRDYVDYRESADGELQGVGLLLESNPRRNEVVVAAPLADSPAQRAGLRRGDVLVAIDGQPLPANADSNDASRRLRGESGTQVSVSFQRFPSGYTPGIPSSPTRPTLGNEVTATGNGITAVAPELLTVTLERAPVHISPVAASKVNMRGQPIGYLRLSQFNAAAGADMRAAVDGLVKDGVRGFVLDLRDNPGGMVNVGLDIAHIFVPGGTPAFVIAGRDGEVQRTIVVPPGPEQTDLPLIVLVNEGSASASEILASTLHDASRAKLVGDATTYGKGRIQALFDLDDGSALFVTVASYQTPKKAEIDHVGIKPDVKCTAPAVRVEDQDDVPIAVRAVGVWQDEPLEELLFSDTCFITASKALAAQVTKPVSTPRLPAIPPVLADTTMRR